MSKEELIAQLQKLPNGTELFSRQGDNAWPVKLRVFEEGNGIAAYFDCQFDNHRNFPEHYSGVKEITQKLLGD